MKKILFVILSFAFLVSLAGCSLFTTLTVDEAKANLEAAGYQVTVMTGEEYENQEEPEYTALSSVSLLYYLYAKNGEEEVKLFFFRTIEDAEFYYSFMNTKLRMGQSNSVIYIGTKQAIKDSKI